MKITIEELDNIITKISKGDLEIDSIECKESVIKIEHVHNFVCFLYRNPDELEISNSDIKIIIKPVKIFYTKNIYKPDTIMVYDKNNNCIILHII